MFVIISIGPQGLVATLFNIIISLRVIKAQTFGDFSTLKPFRIVMIVMIVVMILIMIDIDMIDAEGTKERFHQTTFESQLTKFHLQISSRGWTIT